MQVKILFDKKTQKKNLRIGWGISFLINDRILFDTGENGPWLIKNMKALNVDIKNLSGIVISHDHYDHTGGLWEILKINKKINIYGCANFGLAFKKRIEKSNHNLITISKFTEIPSAQSSKSCKIYSTGKIIGEYSGMHISEQSLVVKTDKGISVMSGCAHPGIIKILNKVKENLNNNSFYSVFGGFHLIEEDMRVINLVADEFKKLKVKKAGPTHCTGEEAEQIFKKMYKNNFIDINVGDVLEI